MNAEGGSDNEASTIYYCGSSTFVGLACIVLLAWSCCSIETSQGFVDAVVNTINTVGVDLHASIQSATSSLKVGLALLLI